MGNNSPSPEYSPSRRSISPSNRKISPVKYQKASSIPYPQKKINIKNKSNLSKILSSPKNIMNFLAQCENTILLKNMNDSNSIGLNHINTLFNPDIINPFLESHLKYIQIIEDSIDKKILGKLKVQNKEFPQKQLESLIYNIEDINNDKICFNNLNLGNISSIQKKKAKRDESPTSQRDDDFDLTSFSTTIGGKASHNLSNNKSYGNNKNNNSKQVRTFKIRTKEEFSQEDFKNNEKNKNNNHSRNNSKGSDNSKNYGNNILRNDSPYSIHSMNSSEHNSNSNVLSSINPNNNYQSKNSSNTSLKEHNSLNKVSNNTSNNILKRKNHKSCLSDVNSFQIVNNTKVTKNINNKNISKKIVRKKLIAPEEILGPKDNINSARKHYKNNTNIDNSALNNFLNINENLTYINNNNLNINNTFSDISIKNKNDFLNKTNILPEQNQRSKSPDLIICKKEEPESENSQIIFNNVRIITGHNYSHSNNNSSMLNNLTNISNLSSKRGMNKTNILNNEKFINNFLEQDDSTLLKTNDNKDNKSYMKGVIKKKKILKKKNGNPFKNENFDNKKKKIELKYIKGVKKINNNNNKVINKTNVTNEGINNKNIRKEIKLSNNINMNKDKKENNNVKEIKNVSKKLNINFNTEKNKSKIDLEKTNKNNAKKNKINTNLILNAKRVEQKKSIKYNDSKNNLKQNNIKTSNSFKKNKEETNKNITLFDDNLENINFLDDEYPEPQDTTLKKNENKKTFEKYFDDNKESNNKVIKSNINNKIKRKEDIFNDEEKINKKIVNNKIQSNIDKIQNIQKKKAIKKPKNNKNHFVFNIDLTEENDYNNTKSEDISDKSFSNEEKIQVNNLNEKKIKQPIKDTLNIINKNNINKTKTEFNQGYNKNKAYMTEDKIIEKKINKINKKPKLRKETNIPNSKINRLIIEKNDNYCDNMDDLDDVCNFSGINNKSYTNEPEIEHKNKLFEHNFDDDFERAHSPKLIFHKKIKLEKRYTNINQRKTKNNINNNNQKEEINDLNYIQEDTNDIDNIDDKIKDYKINENILTNEIKNNINEDELKKENNEKTTKNDKNNNISNKVSNNIYSSSQGYFSFKIKSKNKNNKEKESVTQLEKNINKDDNHKYKKNNESIVESVASSKFNFNINDDIHESEFNDVEFLD